MILYAQKDSIVQEILLLFNVLQVIIAHQE